MNPQWALLCNMRAARFPKAGEMLRMRLTIGGFAAEYTSIAG